MSILPVTIFNKEESIKYYKEASSFGLGKSYYAASIGIPQHDIAGLNFLETEVMGFDSLKPLTSSYNATTQQVDEAGRPRQTEENLTAEGENTRDNDTNANR